MAPAWQPTRAGAHLLLLLLAVLGFVLAACTTGGDGSSGRAAVTETFPPLTMTLTTPSDTSVVTLGATTATASVPEIAPPSRPAGPGCVVVFLADGISPARRDAVARRLRRLDGVASVRFVTKEEALERLRKSAPELVEGMVDNPLPASFEVRPRSRPAATRIRRALTPSPAGVRTVRHGATRSC